MSKSGYDLSILPPQVPLESEPKALIAANRALAEFKGRAAIT